MDEEHRQQQSGIPAVNIDVRSIARFIRQFDVASNIVSRTDNQVRITFVLMFALPSSSNTASLYAIRFFKSAEADDVSNMLDHVYRVRDDLDATQTVQSQLEQAFVDDWLRVFPSVKFVPRIPHVYSFFFDPDAYRDRDIEQQIREQRSRPCLPRDAYPLRRDNDDNDENEKQMTIINQLLTLPPDRPIDPLMPTEPLQSQMFDLQSSDRELLDDESTMRIDEVEDDDQDAKNQDTELYTMLVNDSKPQHQSSNRVDLLGFTDWLRGQAAGTTDSLDSWIEAHHRVDQVLFQRDRLRRMFTTSGTDRRGLPTISRAWTLPFLRLLFSRKINDIIAPKMQKRLMFTHCNYEDGLDRDRIRDEFAVSTDQCRSRRGFNIVLPSEWIESTVLQWSRFEQFCQHVARPDSRFLLLKLYSLSHSIARQSNIEYFWRNAQRIGTSSTAIAAASVTLAAQNRAMLNSIFTTPADQRLMPPPPPPPLSSSSTKRNQHYEFLVDDQLYGHIGPTTNEATIACKRIRFVSSFRCVPKRRKLKSTRLLVDPVSLYDIAASNDPASSAAAAAAPSSQPSIPHISTLICEKYEHWEQALLLYFGLHFLDPDHSINVNGDPGTGKSTVLWYLLQLFSRPICAVPTNKMKHQFAAKMIALSRANFLNFTVGSVQTLSACVKRLGCFKLPPQMYSRVIVKRFTDCIVRLGALISQRLSRYNHELYNVGLGWGGSSTGLVIDRRQEQKKRQKKEEEEVAAATAALDEYVARSAGLDNPNVLPANCSYLGDTVNPTDAVFRPPDVLMLDESNMNTWQHIAFLAHGLSRLRCSLMAFGDSGQNRPIHADPDNSDLIAFSCGGLTVQLLTNKRLCDRLDGNDVSPIARVLDDNVWRLVVSDNNVTVNEAIGNYVRSLLRRNFGDSGIIGRRQLDITDDVDGWCDGIERLHEYYRANPCRRYAYTVAHAREIARQIPRPANQLFLIAQTNVACDRFNYWYLTAFHRRLVQRVFNERNPDRAMFMLYSLGITRQCYIPRRQLPCINTNHITFDDPTYDPETDPAFQSLPSQLDRNEFMFNVRGHIQDDLWASQLRLCIGFCYMYLGTATNCLPPGSLLRLLAVLPDIEKNRNFLCGRRSCIDCQRHVSTFASSLAQRKPTDPLIAISGLLMELVERPSSGASTVVAEQDNQDDDDDDKKYMIVTQEYYQVSRYNSLWCDSKYRASQRANSSFYGFPLRLHSSLTSYKVQGETLYRELYPSVCIDLGNMSRESALVSLSRVTQNSQLCSILNVDNCCPSSSSSSETSAPFTAANTGADVLARMLQLKRKRDEAS